MRRLARSPKRNKRKVVSGSRVTLPENFAYKPGLSFNPLARVTLVVGLPYLLVNRALIGMNTAAILYVDWIVSLEGIFFQHSFISTTFLVSSVGLLISTSFVLSARSTVCVLYRLFSLTNCIESCNQPGLPIP